ncbi:hypothetical protein BGY98DRAFT_1108254 [Russula aff. rugulosa BPL654]|nr:hypothetical protein BGY98DRAFT_1108254 [Russula aff. rugulosa BPL654]
MYNRYSTLETYKTQSQLLLRVARAPSPAGQTTTARSHAQVSAPNCTDSTGFSSYAWSFNSLGQSPCLVVAYLAAVCNNGVFSIPPLLPQHSYTGLSELDIGDKCRCNTIAYNLVSACDACQGEEWTTYSSWSDNCTSLAAPGTFPQAIPAQHEYHIGRISTQLDPITGMYHWRKVSAIRQKLQAALPMSQARLATSPQLRPGHFACVVVVQE